jgi:hypothetical protein
VEGWTVPVTELSGLGVRTDPRTGARQLLGVGDQGFEILVGGPTTGWERRAVEVPAPFGPHRHGGGRSNWEAVVGDASGRVFVVPERHHHLLVLDKDLRFELAIPLENPPSWRRGPGLESVLLLQGGHVLAAKQRDPVMLVEYAPPDDQPIGVGPLSLLGEAEEFDVPRAAGGLHAAATWKPSGRALASINELAVGPGAHVHAVSSISRTVAVLSPLDPREERAGVERIVDADDARLYAARGARLEGLVLDRQAGNFVAVDHHHLGQDALFRVELDAQVLG